MRAFVREQSLSIFFLVIFLAALAGQAIAGHELFNQEQQAHGEQGTSLLSYVFSSHFGNAVLENWQSEYLQFMLFMLATVWLVQRGSPAWAKVRGIRTAIYSNSLLIVMAIIFVGSWFAQSVTGWTEFNADQQTHGEAGVSWFSYIGSADFWEATLENGQSEFLAIGSFAVLTVFLRQRGSPESKPVGEPHDATGVHG